MKKRAVLSPLRRIFAALALLAFSSIKAMSADEPSTDSSALDHQARAYEQATERIRADCVQGRRIICGRILKIFPDGLVVESGYTNLMRAPLNKSWLIPGTVQTTRPASLVEGREPGCVCVGLVFLTALPKSRSTPKPEPYDYVVIQGYPAGQYTYTSVGTIKRTVRRFSASLPTAIRINRAAAAMKPPVFAPAVAPPGK